MRRTEGGEGFGGKHYPHVSPRTTLGGGEQVLLVTGEGIVMPAAEAPPKLTARLGVTQSPVSIAWPAVDRSLRLLSANPIPNARFWSSTPQSVRHRAKRRISSPLSCSCPTAKVTPPCFDDFADNQLLSTRQKPLPPGVNSHFPFACPRSVPCFSRPENLKCPMAKSERPLGSVISTRHFKKGLKTYQSAIYSVPSTIFKL